MSRIPRARLIGLGLLGLVVALAVLVLGQGGAKPAAAQPLTPSYKCYSITGDAVNIPVSVQTQFGVEPDVVVGKPSLLCLPAGVNGEPIPEVPHLKCYSIVGQAAATAVNLTTQFGSETNVVVAHALELCVPVGKAISPDLPLLPPATPDYQCYTIAGPAPTVSPVNLLTQFGTEMGVAIGTPVRLCAPAGINGQPIPAVPHLKCYNIAPPPLVPPKVVNLLTQFGPEPNVPVSLPTRLCVPATKTVIGPAVGGIAEGPGLAGTSGEEAGASAESSGWSSASYAALAGGLAAAVVVLSAGAWYARRRLLR